MKRYISNKILINLHEILVSLCNKSELFVYKKMYDRLDELYKNGEFKEAKSLIDNIKTNSVTISMDIDLRLKEYHYNKK